MSKNMNIIIATAVLLSIFSRTKAIKCYQCSSDEDGPKKDNCGAYVKFDKQSNIAVESATARKRLYLGRSVAAGHQTLLSVADTGVTGVCNWGVYDNGIYWEECYCSEDECNGANFKHISAFVLLLPIGIFLMRQLL
ncbi:hypothetical protein NQ318_022415 [Aromia moschata]|uniref:Protein sleepless n=1 Tax=Aromia moschata TaxID=1265417 RepID=A0AAV8Z7L7_9CUCU|nr:hypothetical protein NQ318_022415 [Aromia moschata]